MPPVIMQSSAGVDAAAPVLGGLTAHNTSRVYSPVTLSSEWPTVGRLLFVVSCSCLGTILNGFFVSSFFVEFTLKKVGNVFLACVGLADLIMTSSVMPISGVVLLSGEWDTLEVCRALQFLGQASTYSYSLFFAMAAIENYYRLCRSSDEYVMFISMHTSCTCVFIFALSFCLSAVGVFLNLDYDYCLRTDYGNFAFRITTLIIFHAVPLVVTYVGFLICAIHIRNRAAKELPYRRSHQYERDYSRTHLDIAVYSLHVLAWIPYLIVVYDYPNAPDYKFYHSTWIAVCRPVLTNFLYCAINRNFRRAFAHLYYYCCCKSSTTRSFSTRHRRIICECKMPISDVRVHIMHQALSSNSPARGASSCREMQEL